MMSIGVVGAWPGVGFTCSAALADVPQAHTAWLDRQLPATFELIENVLGGVADIFPSPRIHIDGDEPRGMLHDLYGS
jgi:N-acetyl-beta-hexosaminidase